MRHPEDLTWIAAERAHAAGLRTFVCAEPEKRLYEPARGKWHPSPWELVVQSGLRDLTPPLPADEGLLLALDDGGRIVAVSHYSFDTDGEQLMVRAMATRVDRRGEGVGRVALDTTLSVLEATKAQYALDCAVWARIDRRNVVSQRLFASTGFECLGPTEGELEMWVRYRR